MSKLTVGKFLKELPSCGDLIPPLAHTTMGTNLHDIIESGEFKVSPCTEFGVPSLYFFVGRPAYKVKEIQNAQFWHLPCVFLCSPPETISPVSIYPFDTGGFKTELLGSEIAGISLENFALPLSYESISKYISAFFENKESYIDGKPLNLEKIKEKFKLKNNAFAIFALSEFINSSGSKSDDRRYTVEVRYETNINILDLNIKLAVIPNCWQDDVSLIESIESLVSKVEYYDIHPCSSNAYVSKIYEICRDYCK